MKNKLILFLILFSFSEHSFFAATPNSFVPSARVTTGSTFTTVKGILSTIFNLPTDTAARVYPSVANGIKIGASSVGAVASSVYSGSAAASSKLLIPLKNGSTFVMDVIGHIPKAKMAEAALSMMKSPYFTIATIAGTALYSWINSSAISISGPGFITNPVSLALPPNCPFYGTATYVTGGITYFYWKGPTSPAPVDVPGYSIRAICADGSAIYFSNTVNVPSSYKLNYPISDADALAKLSGTTIFDPAAALRDLVDNGSTPLADTPIGSAPASTALPVKITTNPDSSTVTEAQFLDATCSGDTCTVAQRTVRTNKDAAGNPTGVTSSTEPPLVATEQGAIPASATPSEIDLSPVVAAVNAAADQAHLDALAQPGETADHVLNDTPASVPPVPEIPDDPDFFAFLQTANPFSWNASGFLPELPETSCSYELHESFSVPFLGTKTFDLAPCDKLEPLRVVLGWVFGVLTAMGVFFIIFNARAQL